MSCRRGKVILLILFAQAASAQTRVELTDGWTLRSADGEIGPVTARVPGVVHTTLREAGIIPDPYFGDNEQRVAWVDSTTWVYETRFHVPTAMQQPVLVFEGLDTIADIYLNGAHVLRADNMFRKWRVPVDPSAIGEEAALRIVFHPAALEAERLAAAYPYPLPEDPRMFVRKAAYHFGWDWGPRFVTAGPWRGVYLEDAALPRLENIYLRTLRIDPARAYVEIVMKLQNVEGGQVHVAIKLDGKEVVRTTVDLNASGAEIFIPFVVDDPQLWWPRGSGEAYLYEMDIEVVVGGHTIREQQRVGIRTVGLDQTGGAFLFVINGENVFVKGANSTPMTSFYPASEEHYRTVLQAAAAANMNMLRVWGGGVYEDDLFYDLADSLGIMVWQDFMFANALYPGTDAFTDNVRHEATEQVSRLRRYPSIVLWCGNNEISEGWHNWGWQEALGNSEVDSHTVWQDYQQLFEELLPSVVAERHPDIPYWPSSPSNGWGNDIAYGEGDIHYWGVWWGRAPFETYREKIGRFNSEYGFQAYPVEATVRTFANDLSEDSDAFRNHQKHPYGFEWLREYAEMTFGHVPENPGLWRYMTQVMQAEGVGMAIAAHRAAKPRTMGTLYWQLNDVWPVISWSSMDMFGRWKPLHFRVRDLYQTLFAEVYQEGDSLRLRVVSDSLLAISSRIRVEAFDTHSGLVWTDSMVVAVPANGGVDRVLIRRDGIAIPDERLVFRIKIIDGERRILLATSSLAPRWDLSLPDPDVQMRVENHLLRVAAARPALGVWIEDTEHGVNLPINYLDLFPGDSISFELPDGVQVADLTIRSLYNFRRP